MRLTDAMCAARCLLPVLIMGRDKSVKAALCIVYFIPNFSACTYAVETTEMCFWLASPSGLSNGDFHHVQKPDGERVPPRLDDHESPSNESLSAGHRPVL